MLSCRLVAHRCAKPAVLAELPCLQCVRAQQQGAFANELYGRVLEDLLCSKTFSAELLGAPVPLSPAYRPLLTLRLVAQAR